MAESAAFVAGRTDWDEFAFEFDERELKKDVAKGLGFPGLEEAGFLVVC